MTDATSNLRDKHKDNIKIIKDFVAEQKPELDKQTQEYLNLINENTVSIANVLLQTNISMQKKLVTLLRQAQAWNEEKATNNSNDSNNAAQDLGVERIDHDRKLARKLIDFMKKSPDVIFVVFAGGNVLAKPGGETIGHHGYYFDSELNKMVMDDSVGFLDQHPTKGRINDYETQPHYHVYGRRIGNTPISFLAKRLPIRVAGTKNPYLTDHRAGVHMTFAIRYYPDKLTTLGNKELEEKIKNQDRNFIDTLFDECGKEFIPDYYNFALSA